MILSRELEREGNWFFRWRSYLPLPIIALLVEGVRQSAASWSECGARRAWGLFCLAVSLLGMAVRAATIGCTPGRTSGRNTRSQVAGDLNTSGMYSVLRHPLYLGNLLITVGISLFTGSWAPALVVVLLFWLYYERIMLAEEAFLQEQFGEEFSSWASATPAFVPSLRNWRPPTLHFAFKHVVRREYGALFGVILVFSLLDALGSYFYRGKIAMDVMWLALLVTGAVLYLLLRFVSKKTSILTVEGR